MPEDTIAWKPAAMSRVESTDEVPKGFQRLVFVGIGLKSTMMEPINSENWKEMYGKDLSEGKNFKNERNGKNVFYHQYNPSQYYSEVIFR